MDVSLIVADDEEIMGVPEIINLPFPCKFVFTILEFAAFSDIFTKICLKTPDATPVKIISPFEEPFVTSTSANFASKSVTIAFLTSTVVEAVTAS